jgi:Carboxypeptidase regulatory-like domain/TonB dependent receptor
MADAWTEGSPMKIRVIIFLIAAFVCNGRAIAGTTGSISGVVTTSAGTPVAAARVTVVSPSQSSSVVTDASGHFTLLSLAPDTYTLTVVKSGFETVATTGISVFADQSQTLRLSVQPTLRTIATVTTRSSMDVVKPGTTSDVYSVNSAVTQAVQGVGGGGNLNNAYSAIATVPGAFVPPNQQGWAQVVYIRGGNYDQIGYEFDGVPVNRSFDNYPGGTAGTLGQQELQVYAGGGTAGESASGLAGFINQVIKTGTFPGYANVSAGIGTPTFYHNLQVEAGGATPDRLFSYYVGIGGYNQDYRYLDQFNGSNLGDVWGYPIIADNTANLDFGGVFPTCGYTAPQGSGFYQGPNASPVYNPFDLHPGQRGYVQMPGGIAQNPGCFQTVTPAYASYNWLADRENVANFHIGIPHRHDGGRDDVQVLFNVTALQSSYYSSQDDLGPHLVQQLNEVAFGKDTPQVWGDFITWPTGTQFGESPSQVSKVAYYMPSSPGDRCANIHGLPNSCRDGTYSAVPNDAQDAFWNNASIGKIQYQHNIGSTAYLRVYGYSFYSDWLQTSPLSFASGLYGFGVTSYDYELESHTRGLALEFADQLDPKSLLTFDANYTTASTNRYNNTNFNNVESTDVTNLTNGTECFDSNDQVAPCNSPHTSGTFHKPEPFTAFPGTQWEITNTGNSGFVNNVTPNFTALGLQDEWSPTDKIVINLGLRDELYAYNLANTSNDGQNFWFLAGQREFCYNPTTLQPYFIAVPPASGRPPKPFIGFDCPVDSSIPAHPVQTVHPDGKDGHLLLNNQYSPSVSDNAFTPQVGATYTIDNDTVLRFSAGRFAQEPETYQVQYNAKDNNLAYDLFQAFWQYGYTTPRHDPAVQYSDNFDASLEKRFKGTDMSIKLTPYYRYATNQVYSVALPFGLSGGLNSGIERVDGVEFEFTKGDFNKDGLAFLFSYTYTNAAEKWANYPGTSINPIDPYNQDIANFNGLTKAGGGSRCYENDTHGNVYPDPSCGQLKTRYNPPILNPYYGMKPEPLLDRNGWYPVGLDYSYLSPNVLSAVVNYKRHKFSITPALTFNEGQPYGNPADVMGIDPRACTANSAHISGASSPLQADYTSCGLAATQNGTEAGVLYIPNPQTGRFDSFGAFRQPSQLNLSMSMGYQITPRIKVNVLLANLANACFGGSSEPWTKQYPPNSYTCGYISNYYYVSNFYNGSSPNDRGANGVALNPAFANSYIPAYADANSFVLPGPFNAFVQFEIKI